MRRTLVAAALLSAAATLLLATAATATHFGEEPPDCTAAQDGQQWRDPFTYILWECVPLDLHDYLFGWEPVNGVGWNEAITVVAPSVNLCLHEWSGLSRVYFGGSWHESGVARVISAYGSCETRKFQPAGEMRARDLIDRWNGSSWVNCLDSGNLYSSTSAWDWMVGWRMQSFADCGPGTYRNRAVGQVWEPNSWFGNTLISPNQYLP